MRMPWEIPLSVESLGLAEALEVAGEDGVGTHQIAGSGVLDVALTVARIALLLKRRLFAREVDHLLGIASLQRQPSVMTATEATVVQNLLHRDRQHPPAFVRVKIIPTRWWREVWRLRRRRRG